MGSLRRMSLQNGGLDVLPGLLENGSVCLRSAAFVVAALICLEEMACFLIVAHYIECHHKGSNIPNPLSKDVLHLEKVDR